MSEITIIKKQNTNNFQDQNSKHEEKDKSANENKPAYNPEDFLMRVKISRKEAKESHYWIRLINETNDLYNANEAMRLIREAGELKKIFSSIIVKSE